MGIIQSLPEIVLMVLAVDYNLTGIWNPLMIHPLMIHRNYSKLPLSD